MNVLYITMRPTIMPSNVLRDIKNKVLENVKIINDSIKIIDSAKFILEHWPDNTKKDIKNIRNAIAMIKASTGILIKYCK